MNKAVEQEKAAIFAEEAFVVDAQLFLNDLMIEKGISRADLARAMGVSRARVTQIFSDECKNFTVRLLARAVHVMGEQVELALAGKQLKSTKDVWAEQKAIVEACENVFPIWSEDDFLSNDDEPWVQDHRLDAWANLQRAA